MEHTYDCATGGIKSLFYVRMPSDMESSDLIGESVISLDFIRFGEIIMRCKNPYISNGNPSGDKGIRKHIYEMVWKSFDSNAVCGSYKQPFVVVSLKRNGDTDSVQTFELPVFKRIFDVYDKESDVVYLVTYTSREVEFN